MQPYSYFPKKWAFGNDIEYLNGVSYIDCVNKCNQNPKCYQFNSSSGLKENPEQKGECYLKENSTENDRSDDSNWSVNYKN